MVKRRTPKAEPIAVTPEEAARLLSISKRKLGSLVSSGEIESFKVGRARRVVVRSIREYIERQMAAAS